MSRKVGAAVLLTSGLVINKWTVQWALASDGEITATSFVVVIVLVQLVLVGTGWWLWTDRSIPVPPVGAAGLTIGATVATVLGLELVALVTPMSEWLPPPPVYVGERSNRASENFVADPDLGWRMAANSEFFWTVDGVERPYRANADGFRDRAWTPTVDRPLAVVIGDSFTFGSGVAQEDAFPARLHARSDAHEVRNAALPGFGIDQMLMTWRTVVRPMNPDLIIVAFIDHDLDRTMTAYRVDEGFNKPVFTTRDGPLRPQTTADRPTFPIRMLERYSFLYRLVEITRRRRANVTGRGEWWRRNSAIFEAMHSEIVSTGAHAVFVRLPLPAPRAFPVADTLFAKLGATYIDLNSESGPEGIHFANADHINATGNAFVADTLWRLWPTLLSEATR